MWRQCSCMVLKLGGWLRDWSRSGKCSSIRAWETSCGFCGLKKSATISFGGKTGHRPIEQEIRQRAWGWIGHTLRRPDGHVAKRALEWNPQGKRKRGRPQHTWKRTRMAGLERKNLTWSEAKDTAKNRVRWRALVDALCSLCSYCTSQPKNPLLY